MNQKLSVFYKNIKSGPSFKEFLQTKSLSPPQNIYTNKRLPEWLKTTIPCGGEYSNIKKTLREAKLSTVCEEARCPNITECWNSDGDNVATATIMIMGDTCTRACRFCSVKTSPKPNALDEDEPLNVAKIVATWPIDYIVMTSVDRDDLEDAGSKHIAKTITLMRQYKPQMMIECLVPDFSGKESSIQDIVNANLDVYAHNIETVKSLQKHVRDYRANYEQSMFTLRYAKEYSTSLERKRQLITKSSIMLGLGETDEEVYDTLRDLRSNNVDIVTLGQYVRPTKRHLKVRQYVDKEKFEFWQKTGIELGFLYVASGPLVRSSYRAGEIFIKNILKKLDEQKKE